MRKFIDSQVKSKDERMAEKEASRLEREERKAERAAAKAEKEREAGTLSSAGDGLYGTNFYGQPSGLYAGNNGLLPASGAEFDSGPHYRHFGRRLANPAPLGLFAFSFSTFLLGLVNLRAQGVTETSALVGPFLLYSSVMMGVTAIFELVAGNTFGATAFGTFAGFFLSLGAIILPSFGTFDAFINDPLRIYNFLGLFFATWLIPFGIFCFLTIRSTWTLWLQFIFIFAALAVSCAQYLTLNNVALQKAAGAILIVVSFFGYLNGAAGLMAKETVFFQPPVLQMPWSARRHGSAQSHGAGIAHGSNGVGHGNHDHGLGHDHEHGLSGRGQNVNNTYEHGLVGRGQTVDNNYEHGLAGRGQNITNTYTTHPTHPTTTSGATGAVYKQA